MTLEEILKAALQLDDADLGDLVDELDDEMRTRTENRKHAQYMAGLQSEAAVREKARAERLKAVEDETPKLYERPERDASTLDPHPRDRTANQRVAEGDI